MTSLIVKADIEAELQTTLAATYTSDMITALCTWADSMLKFKTNRTSFSGITADIAKHAELCLAIDRLATSNRDIVKTAISSISENGNSITFSNGKTIEVYKNDAAQAIADLKLPGTPKYDITFPDLGDSHTGTEGSILY